MSFSAGISATKAGFDLIKSLRDALGGETVNPGDIQARLVELQSFLLDAQMALSDGQEENRQLQARIGELVRMADFGKDFHKQYGLYWRDGYPHCAVCWDVDRKPVRLSGPNPLQGMGPVEQWVCPLHKQPLTLPWKLAGKVPNPTG